MRRPDRHPARSPRRGRAPRRATFLLFAIAFFGALLLIPLYYQTVRGASALESGLLLAPQGLGAMITMPLAEPRLLRSTGSPLRHPAAGDRDRTLRLRHRDDLLRAALQLQLRDEVLGMGLAMMPTMTAAMQAVPAAAIARTSTAMNIIRQGGA